MTNKTITQALICGICQFLCCKYYCYILRLLHWIGLMPFSISVDLQMGIPWLPLDCPHFQSLPSTLGISAIFLMFAIYSLLIFLFAYFFQLQGLDFWISVLQLSFLVVSHVFEYCRNFWTLYRGRKWQAVIIQFLKILM